MSSALQAGYLDHLQQLLPLGMAWTREPEAWLTELLAVAAEQLAEVHDHADSLLWETYPTNASQTLASREAEATLPDPCYPALTTDERHRALLLRWAGRGGQSAQWYIDLAAVFGYVISIQEYRPFVAGTLTGHALTDDPWLYAWAVVSSPINTFTSVFTSGAVAGDPLRHWQNQVLECLIRRAAPAHTIVLFEYTGV
jgi:uncharacterized protein YmfQ (DUF2313 family)